MEMVLDNGFCQLDETELFDVDGGGCALGSIVCGFLGGQAGKYVGAKVGGAVGGPVGAVVGGIAGVAIYECYAHYNR